MQSESNEPSEHRHPELEQMIAERYRLLHEVMVTGFADLTREVRDGLVRINQRINRIDERLDGIDGRLNSIDAHLRRINPNGHQP
jgi:hypothetical protein